MPATRFHVEIRPVLPERLRRLEELANDLYFTWERGVRQLFAHLDQECWDHCGHNPKVFLRRVPQRKLEAAANDPILLAEYRRVLSAYDTYMEDSSRTESDRFLDRERDLVAYFSAEFGFHQSIPIYAGGLGILAADYCKAMSNLWVPFVGVGMLYRQGYFTQRILCHGEQVADYPYTEATDLPVTPAVDSSGEEVRVQVGLPGRSVQLRVWEAKAGHIRLFLLDSDVPENEPEDRAITHQLYGGDINTRIHQEMVLGIGGVRTMRALGLNPTVWHINEGHAAFLILERCREHAVGGLDFRSAAELVAANTVFTTHTPVPAGHDVFDAQLMRTHFSDFLAQVGADESDLLSLGASPRQPHGFNMTSLALRCSRFHNGVSRIHGRVASQMESYIWPQVPPHENSIGHVTNGVDIDTFLGRSWVALFDMYMGGGWRAKLTDAHFWKGFIDSIPNHVYLSVRQILKSEMLESARRRAVVQYKRSNCTDSVIEQIIRRLRPQNLDTLVIGFARRFATYKRASLLFQNLDRLARILNDPERPVLFIFAGKAHPNDLPGQSLIRQVFEMSMRPELLGKIILLEDYNLSLARDLMPGVDVWLNVPEYPKEACGTSGMKAAANGAINLSVLDGWWGEAYDGENGWAIAPRPEADAQTRDRQEAEELLNLLERQVIPLYYKRNAEGEPEEWVLRSKASMKSVLPNYNSIRMAVDYLRGYYGPARDHGRSLWEEDAAGARELAQWKQRVAAAWDGVRIRLANAPPDAVTAGNPIRVEVAVDLNGLAPEDVVVECVIGRLSELGDFLPAHQIAFKATKRATETEQTYRIDLASAASELPMEGLQHYEVRVYPHHPLQAHPFECGCMLWL
ncbi:MAG: alpha-glucan family phosphorylase [Chromatiaceae bacterium]